MLNIVKNNQEIIKKAKENKPLTINESLSLAECAIELQVRLENINAMIKRLNRLECTYDGMKFDSIGDFVDFDDIKDILKQTIN